MSDNRRFIIKIDGSAVTEHTVPFRLLAGVLNGIQQTFYYIALAEVKKEGSGRGKIPQDIQQACELSRVLEKPGSYEVLAEIADVNGASLFSGIDIGQQALNKYLHMVEILSLSKDLSSLDVVIPDGIHRRRILRSIETYCPKEGDEWQLLINDKVDGKNRALTKEVRNNIKHALSKPEEEARIITGELVRLHLDEHKIGILYPPTGRVLECFYDPEIEDFVIENLKGYVQVTGRVQLDANGQPDKIIDAREILELDLSPIKFSRIGDANRTLILNKVIYLEPQFNEIDQEVIIELSDYKIISEGSSREQAFKNFEEDFLWLWQEYALTDDKVLSPDAINLKRNLLALVKEVDDEKA